MAISTERLKRAKKDIELTVAAIETGDDSNVSQEGRDLFEQLASLDDVEWDRLLSSLGDHDLRNQLDVVRGMASEAKELSANIFSPIVSIGGSLSFDFSFRSLAVRLHFKSQNRSFESSQDLEDTLLIGAAVVKMVKRSMYQVDNMLSPEAKRVCIGGNFEERLKQIEEDVGEVRRVLTSIHEPDPPDGKA